MVYIIQFLIIFLLKLSRGRRRFLKIKREFWKHDEHFEKSIKQMQQNRKQCKQIQQMTFVWRFVDTFLILNISDILKR